MNRIIAALIAASAVAFATAPAQAKYHHYKHYRYTIEVSVRHSLKNEHVARHYAHRKRVVTREHAFYQQPAVADTDVADQRYALASNSVSRATYTEQSSNYSYAGEHVVGGRPSGCPHAFCGCEASRYVFGKIYPDLNLAYNWIVKFPRTSPAPGMAAARNHHVMVLISQISGSDWLVHDGNSGGHLTRDHVRSIAGYVIVDPHGSKMAMR